MFTQTDKIAKLQRLVRQIGQWEFQKKLPPIAQVGTPAVSIGSSEFQEWRTKVKAAIALIFGEHSHYVDDFEEIQYTDFVSHLLAAVGEPNTKLWEGLEAARGLLQRMIDEIKASEESSVSSAGTVQQRTTSHGKSVFIGHGRSLAWLAVRRVLQEEWGLKIVCFESEPRTSKSIVSILNEMLDQANFGVIVLTAEDVTSTGEVRGRQNVIHEAGLAQGKLGFEKVVILKQEGVEEPSNLAGLQYISFPENKIEKAFYELQAVLKRERLIL
jgi:predicted nucleotide-binding protein